MFDIDIKMADIITLIMAEKDSKNEILKNVKE